MDIVTHALSLSVIFLLGVVARLRHFTPSEDCDGGFKELEPIEENLQYDFNYQVCSYIDGMLSYFKQYFL